MRKTDELKKVKLTGLSINGLNSYKEEVKSYMSLLKVLKNRYSNYSPLWKNIVKTLQTDLGDKEFEKLCDKVKNTAIGRSKKQVIDTEITSREVFYALKTFNTVKDYKDLKLKLMEVEMKSLHTLLKKGEVYG